MDRMFERLIDMIDHGAAGYIIAAAFLSIVSLERIAYLLTRDRWSHGDALPNLGSAAIGVVVNGGAGALFAMIYTAVYAHRLATVPITLAGFAGAYLVFELFHYLQHRLAHRTGLFWAFHSVHHSSTEMNVLVADRIMWGILLTLPLTILVMPLLGVSLSQFLLINLVTSIYGLFTHTRLIPRLGVLEHVLVTPANHRVHHGRQLKYLDRNYGQSLLLFDKLFGTHQVEEEEPEYGLVQQTRERNPLRFQTAGIAALASRILSAPRWADKWAYLWKPPGWSHDGVLTTTEALRAEAATVCGMASRPTSGPPTV